MGRLSFQLPELSVAASFRNRQPWSRKWPNAAGPEGWLSRTRLLPLHYFVVRRVLGIPTADFGGYTASEHHRRLHHIPWRDRKGEPASSFSFWQILYWYLVSHSVCNSCNAVLQDGTIKYSTLTRKRLRSVALIRQ